MRDRLLKTPRAALALLALAFLVAPTPPAAAQFVPYFGKNKVKYDNFAWRIYKSPHFEIYYYPEFEQHLARLSSYAESAYQKVSSELKHEISFPIPLILYKTHSEFEETNLSPDFVPEGVLAFAEPGRNRMVLPIDEPPDRLQGLITHELTHVFEFDLIPRFLGYGVMQRSIPLWVDEGLADYMRGLWDPLDLMTIRDAAVTDQVPKISRLQDYGGYNPRVVYNLGHATFEFIAARYGKEGIRQFLYTLRKGIVGGGPDEIYQQSFRLKPEEFDDAFEKWLKERFKPFRDKQRPGDYGRELSPNEEKTPFTQVYGFSPSPSGEMVAAVTANRSDGKADIVLLSAHDRTIIGNLTKGYANEFDDITVNLSARAIGRSVAFDPRGDAVAFFARIGKRRSLIVVSVLTGKVVRKIPIDLDEAEAPCLLPDGKGVLFSALKEGVSDIYLMDLESGRSTNLTKDAFYDSDPQVSPDGRLVVYTRRISGHNKIYSFPLSDPSRKTQLTFGVHEDATPVFSTDGSLVYYASDEDDDIYNLRSLDLKTGVVRQYTDVLGGNMAPAPLRGKGGDQLGFVSYYKGDFGLRAINVTEPVKEVEQEVQVASEEIIDFQPDLVHQVVSENKRGKRLFEKLYLEGRPPLNLGVTSSGDFFGGSSVALSDVLGDQNFFVNFLSVRDLRSYEGTYVNLASRLHYGISIFDTTRFFFSSPYDLQPGFSRQGAFATQRITGANLIAQYPFDKYRRLEMSAGAYRLKEQFEDPTAEAIVCSQAAALGTQCLLNSGTIIPFAVSFVQETTRFREFGPLTGSTVALGLQVAPSIGGSLSRQTIDLDARKYFRLGQGTVFAVRARGFKSIGGNPGLFYFGGNMELRGYPYLSFSGNEGFFANVELRLPIIDVAKTPIGLIGPVRGTIYAGIGTAHYKGDPTYAFASSAPDTSYVNYPGSDVCSTTPDPACLGESVTGYHLVSGRASYGIGLQLFFLGYPLHFDWSRLTDLKVSSKTRLDFWIGFDF